MRPFILFSGLFFITLHLVGCGVGSNTNSQQVGALNFAASPFSFSGGSCQISVEVFNTLNQDVILQTLQIQSSSVESNTTATQALSAAELQALIPALYLGIGTPVEFTLTVDVSSFTNGTMGDTTVDLAVILIGTTAKGTPVFFSGNCSCVRS